MLTHLLLDPALQFFPVHRRQFAEIGTQPDRIANIDVLDFGLCELSIPMDEDPDALLQSAGDRNLMSAQQGNIEPAQLPGSERWELRVEVGRGGENGAGHVLPVDPIPPDHKRNQLPRGRKDFVARILRDGGRPANTATRGHKWAPKIGQKFVGKPRKKSNGACIIIMTIDSPRFQHCDVHYCARSWLDRVGWAGKILQKGGPKTADLTR
jgi:hypothetical protein